MFSLHYGFVLISEPMAGTLSVQLCLKTVLSAHYQVSIYYTGLSIYLFYSDQKRNMYVCLYCHGYADHLGGLTSCIA